MSRFPLSNFALAQPAVSRTYMMQRRFTIFVIGAPLLFFGLLIIFGRSRPVAFLRIQAARIAAPFTHAAGRAGGRVGLGLEGLSAERIRGLEEDAQHLAAVEAQSRALEKEMKRSRAPWVSGPDSAHHSRVGASCSTTPYSAAKRWSLIWAATQGRQKGISSLTRRVCSSA